MLIYLDSNFVIYVVEDPPTFGPRALAHIAALRANGDEFAVSHLTRLECRVQPLALGDTAVLNEFERFFATADVHVYALAEAVYERAASIRAQHRFKLADALHLACAVEIGCDAFLTQDVRLNRYPDIPVNVFS